MLRRNSEKNDDIMSRSRYACGHSLWPVQLEIQMIPEYPWPRTEHSKCASPYIPQRRLTIAILLMYTESLNQKRVRMNHLDGEVHKTASEFISETNH